MTSLRAWFLPFMVLSMAATGQAQAESTSDTAARGTIEDRPKPAPVVTHADPSDDVENSGAPLAVAPSAIRGRIPVAQQAMVAVPAGPFSYSQQLPGNAGPAMYPGAVHPAAYADPSLAAPPLPFPGTPPIPGSDGSAADASGGYYDGGGYSNGGCKGCGGSGSGCKACSGGFGGFGLGGLGLGGFGGLGGNGCQACGGYGCENCHTGVAGGLLASWLYGLLPYSEGGRCAPRWYDITMDALYLTREEVSRRVAFTTSGINGDVVLSTDSLDFDHQLGFRFTGSLQLFAGSNIEMTYFGLMNWATGAAVDDPTNMLFSVYSNFGQNPAGGFDETDRSSFQRITYSSTLDNFELNFRKRWTGPNCHLQGSWLYGVRYLYLLEDFSYDTIGAPPPAVPPGLITGRSETVVTTRNSLTGFQMGGDLWSALVPGVLVGAEAKAGIYGNYANQNTTVVATTNAGLPSTFLESADINDVAFVAEANVQFIYRINPNWTLGGNFNFVYLDGVALAPENFNIAAPPNLQTPQGPRPVAANDNGDLFYHGFGARLEYMW